MKVEQVRKLHPAVKDLMKEVRDDEIDTHPDVAAWEDLMDCRPMTRHLACFLVLDPQDATATFMEGLEGVWRAA